MESQRVRRRWIGAWLGGPVLGIVNGAARDLLYKERVGELRSQQISTATLLIAISAYFSVLQRRWPIPAPADAAAIGGTWMALTVAFEFGFGHYVAKDPWSELLEAYDVREGRLWPLVPLWMGVGPLVMRELVRPG